MHASRQLGQAAILALGALLAASATPVAAADTTPPIGGMELWDSDADAQVIDFHLTFADPESGIASLDVACDDNPPATRAMSSHLLIPYFDTSQGGCIGYGQHTIAVTAWNGDGLSTSDYHSVTLGYTVNLSISSPRITGHPFTITPNYPDGYTFPADAMCQWELRWGNEKSLNHNDFDASFGSLLLAGPKGKGFCGPWTFTLPWVPVLQFQVSFKLESETDVLSDTWGFKGDGHGFITASVDSTERRITSSNLPLMFLLPDEYIATVGEPITYRLYPLAGAKYDDNDSWAAYWENGEHAFVKAGGRSFTFTPDRPGNWSVFWNASGNESVQLGAGYDPPAKYRDTHRPTTTAPKAHVGPGLVGSSVPTTLTWNGSDVGWGIDHYKLQRSVDGGAWGATVLTKSKSRSVSLAVGHRYRYRVRAVDKAGHVGDWDYGPTFKVVAKQETSSLLTWHGTWLPADAAGAWGGHSRQSSVTNASGVYTFSGRSIGWIAGRDPTFGSAKVYVDGKYVTTVNLNAASPTHRAIVWRKIWSSKASHKLRIVVVGTAGHPTVDVDGFVVFR